MVALHRSEFRELSVSDTQEEPIIARRIVIPILGTVFLEISRHGIAFFRGAHPDIGGYRLHITYNPEEIEYMRKVLLLAALALQRYEQIKDKIRLQYHGGETYVIDLVSDENGGDGDGS